MECMGFYKLETCVFFPLACLSAEGLRVGHPTHDRPGRRLGPPPLQATPPPWLPLAPSEPGLPWSLMVSNVSSHVGQERFSRPELGPMAVVHMGWALGWAVQPLLGRLIIPRLIPPMAVVPLTDAPGRLTPSLARYRAPKALYNDTYVRPAMLFFLFVPLDDVPEGMICRELCY